MKIEQYLKEQFQILKKGHFWRETTGVISLPLSVEEVGKKLSSIFSSPLDLSDYYYFSSLVDCKGKITNNSLRIEFIKYQKGTLRYNLKGQILNNSSDSSSVELIIYGNNSLWGYLGIALVGFFIPILIGKSLLISWFMILLSGICLAIILVLIYFAFEIVTRRSVLKNICEFLQEKLIGSKTV